MNEMSLDYTWITYDRYALNLETLLDGLEAGKIRKDKQIIMQTALSYKYHQDDDLNQLCCLCNCLQSSPDAEIYKLR